MNPPGLRQRVSQLFSSISSKTQVAGGLIAASLVVALAAPGPAQAFGRWEHGWHGDHFGWFWVDAGLWSLYAANAPWYGGYPYPYPYPYAYPYPAPYYGAATEGAVALPPPPQVWYYCDAGAGYYPQIPSCPAGWRVVTVSAPSAAPASAPPAAVGAAPATAPGYGTAPAPAAAK